MTRVERRGFIVGTLSGLERKEVTMKALTLNSPKTR
jgi:hypothetical protein